MTAWIDRSQLRWADLVFHVLCHVRPPRPLAASLWNRGYVGYCAQHLGPAQERALGQDVQVLEGLLTTHDVLASVQALAWLFRDVEQATDTAQLDLGYLEAADVDESARQMLLTMGAEAELLRCAALLEMDTWARLPPWQTDAEALAVRLDELSSVAPWLRRAHVGLVPSLGRHGRVRGHRVLVGVPVERGEPSLEHVAWQACHEATVGEVVDMAGSTGLRLTHDPRERAALMLLRARAMMAGQGDEHAQWLAALGLSQATLASWQLSPFVLDLLQACITTSRP